MFCKDVSIRVLGGKSGKASVALWPMMFGEASMTHGLGLPTVNQRTNGRIYWGRLSGCEWMFDGLCSVLCMGVYACLCVWACGMLSSMDLNFRILLKDSPESIFIRGFNKITFDKDLSINLSLLIISQISNGIPLPV